MLVKSNFFPLVQKAEQPERNLVAMPNGGFVVYDIAIRQVRYLGKSLPLASDLKRPFAIHNEIPRTRVGDSMILSHLTVEISFAFDTDIDMRNKSGHQVRVVHIYLFRLGKIIELEAL